MTKTPQPRVTVDTDAYFASYLTRPRGHGLWIFQHTDGTSHEVTDFYGAATATLPKTGTWKVLP
jgi:hypothetical protein